MKKPRVSIVMPVYKPDLIVLNKIREMIQKQTISSHSELIEKWNNPEAVSLNLGIKEAKGDIIVTLSADCLPQDEKWLEKLIKPLENKEVVVSVSDIHTPQWYWKKYSLLTRILTLKEVEIARPIMDARACAFRKKDLLRVGLFNEDPRVIGIDTDLYMKLKNLGRIVHTGVFIGHLHWLTAKTRLKMFYDYSEANGKLVKKYGKDIDVMWRRIFRAIPLFGIISVLVMFPYRKHVIYFPLFVPAAVFEHLVWVYGFWKGFFFNKGSSRNIINREII